jgi:hypothetical protein
MVIDELQFQRNIEILRRSRRDRDDMMQSAYIIEQKAFHLKKETRNNLTLLSVILFVLIVLCIPFVDNPDPKNKDTLITRYNNETQALFKNEELLAATRHECVIRLKTWYYLYIVVIIFKYLLTLLQFCHVRGKQYNTVREVRKAEKNVAAVQLFTYIYVNGLFMIVLFLGNYIYWRQNEKEKAICYNISGEFMQITSLSFLLIVFGWCQGAYYLTIWCSVVAMKCKG